MSLDTNILTAYFKDAGFMRWLMEQHYTKYNADNIHKYFARYQHILMCLDKKCHDCAGSIPVWDCEDDILIGKIRHDRCYLKIGMEREQAATQHNEHLVIPPAYKDMPQLKSIKVPAESWDLLKQYVIDFPKFYPNGIYLYATKHGAGRTTLMWWLVKELAAAKKLSRGVLLKTSHNLALLFQQESYDHPMITYAKHCDVLMLDDFGQEKHTEWTRNTFESIIEERTWNNRPTIVSSIIPCSEHAWTKSVELSLFLKLQRQCTQIFVDNSDEGAI